MSEIDAQTLDARCVKDFLVTAAAWLTVAVELLGWVGLTARGEFGFSDRVDWMAGGMRGMDGGAGECRMRFSCGTGILFCYVLLDGEPESFVLGVVKSGSPDE